MIFGHFGLAFMWKAKFYKKSLILLLICCYLPDILFYIFFGIEWTIKMPQSPIFYGALQWILKMTGGSFSLVEYPLALSHSIAIYVIFVSIFLLIYAFQKKSLSGLIYGGAIFSHLLFDYLFRDANIANPIVYPFYPFDPNPYHFLPPDFAAVPHLAWLADANLFWLVDLTVFIVGLFLIMWAFSKKEGREFKP